MNKLTGNTPAPTYINTDIKNSNFVNKVNNVENIHTKAKYKTAH